MNLLFVCTHNACRSILAEATTRALAGDRIAVASAGSEPAGRVHPLTRAFLASRGHDADTFTSKGFDDLGEFRPDAVVTVCDTAANETCPVWLVSDAATAHWGLPDPSHLAGTDHERAAAFEAIARTLESRVRRLLDAPFESMDRTSLTRFLDSLAAE